MQNSSSDVVNVCVDPNVLYGAYESTSGSEVMFYGAFLNTFDLSIYRLINGFAGHDQIVDAVMVFFAKDALEIYAVLFVIAWFTLPKGDIHNRHALVVTGFSGILALVINVAISHIWFRPRPFAILPKGSYTELISHSVDASFPSDHASGSFGFAAASWGKSQKWIRHSFTIIAAVVMFARVFVGVHYPTDVLAGLVVGILSSRIVWKLSRYLFPLTTIVAQVFRFGPASRIPEHVE